eukprot:1666700-Amphidinium_carterae.1
MEIVQLISKHLLKVSENTFIHNVQTLAQLCSLLSFTSSEVFDFLFTPVLTFFVLGGQAMSCDMNERDGVDTRACSRANVR